MSIQAHVQRASSWRVLLIVMAIAQLAAAVGFSISVPFLPIYVDLLGSRGGLATPTMAGLVLSAQALAAMVAAPIWGALGDRLGRKPMVARAMLGSAIAMTGMAFAQTAEHLVLLYALQGALGGTVPTASAMVAAAVPRAHLGRAMGALHGSQWAGLGLGPLIGGIVASTLGFRSAFLVTGSLLAIAAAVVIVFAVEQRSESRPPVSRSWPRPRLALLVQRPLRRTFLARFASTLGRSMALPVAPLLVLSLSGAERAPLDTGMAFGLAAFSGIIGSIIAGRMGDRYGHTRVIGAYALLAAMLFAPLGLSGTSWQFIVLFGASGFAVGGLMPNIGALLAARAPAGREGETYGFEGSVMGAARAIAPTMGGLMAASWGYQGTFMVAALFFATVSLIVRERSDGHSTGDDDDATPTPS